MSGGVIGCFVCRSLSFRNYQVATWALKDKLLMLNSHTKTESSANKLSLNLTKTKESTATTKESTQTWLSPSNTDSKTSHVLAKVKPTCSICNRTFNRAYDFKRHSLVHFNVEHFDSKDRFGTDSSQSLAGKANPNLEVKSVVTYSCEVCSRIFKVKDSFERHKRIHTNERPFKCGECDKQFRDSGGLLRHVKEVHEKVRNHLCNICHKWFVNRPTLEDHLRSHSGERPFVCHQCGLMFKSKSSLYQHSKTHSDILPHVCVYCRKGFRRRQELIAHTSTHTNEKKHICEKCGKGFRTRSELQRHIVVHSDEKPFSCLICNLNFSQKRYLKNHVKSRHGRLEEIPMQGLMSVENLGFRC